MNNGCRVRLCAIGCWVFLLAAGCTRYVVGDFGSQAYYQTGSPIHDTSGELERIVRSIKRLGVTSNYTTYRFAREDSVTDAAIRSGAALARARERFTFDHSKGGTATIIASTARGLTLITNDHVTRVPDTVIVHFGDRGGQATDQFVESVSILTSQRNFVVGLPDVLPFTVLARDSSNDLALIGVDLPRADQLPGVHVLRVPMGDPSRLAWGSFVYVLGFPRGFRMVTRGIVSDPRSRRDDGFLLDGLFNRGISGGLILAVRGDTGALEWVGLASTASAEPDDRIVPEPRHLEEQGLLVPYEGRLYLERVSRIEYGITFPVSMTAIRRFLRNAQFSRPRD